MNEPFAPETVAAVTALIKLVADPEGCAKRLAELRQLTATAKAAQQKLDSDRAQYARELEADAAAMEAREQKLRRSEVEVMSLRAQLAETVKIRETYYLDPNLGPGGRSYSGLARAREKEMAEPATSPASAPAAPSAPSSPATSPASRPGVDAHYDNLPDADRGRFARVRKGPDGGSEWREISAEGDAAKPASADGKASIAEDGRLKVGEMLLSEEDIRSLMTTKAANDLKAAQIPADANGYKIELPKDLTLPAGVDWKFNMNDPALAAARVWAHGVGLSQDQFSGLLGQYASIRGQEEASFRNAMKAELDKLGVNGTMRVTALDTWLRGTVGDDLAGAMRAGMYSEKIVRGLEAIATKMMSQGAASYSQSGRNPPEQQGRVSDEQYAAMSAGERLDYARTYDQSQFRNGGR